MWGTKEIIPFYIVEPCEQFFIRCHFCAYLTAKSRCKVTDFFGDYSLGFRFFAKFAVGMV